MTRGVNPVIRQEISPYNHQTGGRFSKGQGRRREAGSETERSGVGLREVAGAKRQRSPEQSSYPKNMNRIRGRSAG